MDEASSGKAPAVSPLHRELVPLAEAAAVAYHIIIENPQPLRDPRELDEVRRLVAIALSSVAPILNGKEAAAQPMSAAEIERELFAPLLNRAAEARPSTEFPGLHIRRGDLVRAVEVLKQAHIGFGREEILAALKERQG
jgi:hypothetical protein